MITAVINIDSQRRIKIKEELEKANLDFFFLDGVLVKKEDVVYNRVVKKAGNVGCMLSKIAAWEWVVSKNETCNLIEDDESIPEDYLVKRNELLKELDKGYEFILLNVFRPCGELYSKNFLKITKNLCKYDKYPNVWNSNYIITPKFATVLLDSFKNHIFFKYIFNKIASDKVVSKILTDLSGEYNFFTIRESNLLTKHFEGKSLRKENNL